MSSQASLDMTASMPESSSRNRSDSLDDTGLPEQERKRPRLSSARSSSGEALTDLAFVPATHSNLHENGARQVTPPLSNADSINANMATSPTSKVTINTRSLLQQQPSPDAKQVEPEAPATSSSSDGASSSTNNRPADLSNMTEALPAEEPITTAPPDTISIPSSPSKSPEIQVAEIEDYDQDPSETKWTPVTRISGNIPSSDFLQPHYIHRTFPYARINTRQGASNEIIPDMSRYFQYGNDRDGEVFGELRLWLREFLRLHDRLTIGFLAEEPNFWKEFPDLVGALLRREITAPAQARPQDLEEFFVDYGRLIILLIQFDLRQLRSFTDSTDGKETLDLFCRPYLPTLTWMLQYRDIPFYETLRKSSSYNPVNLISAVTDRLIDRTSINFMHFLTELAIEIATSLPRIPSLSVPFHQLLTAASQFIRSIPERLSLNADPIYKQSSQIDDIKTGVYQFFQTVDELLQKAIVKQLPWLTIENSPDLLRVISRSMQYIADQIPGFGLDVIGSCGVDADDFDSDELRGVVSYAWKFRTLRKYITNGRMELRVHGIDAMQSDLVNVWRDHIQYAENCLADPLVVFLVKFIQDTKLIDYIIGVDSHPQLINRSSNIVGFLCVAGTYADIDTDTMWRTVTESQDPRTIVEVLHVMQSTFKMSQPSALQYICSKLLALPVERFDLRMLDFTAELLQTIREKSQPAAGIYENCDPATVRLCVRLLREASASNKCQPEQLVHIRHVASDQLGYILRSSRIDEREQESFWQQIFQDVAANNDFATGSIQALNSWLMLMPIEGIIQIATQYDFTRLLVRNVSFVSEQFSTNRVCGTYPFDVTFQARLTALFYLITGVPWTIDSDLIESLWTSLFTNSKLTAPTRCSAWETLTNVIKSLKGQANIFIDKIITDYVPRLHSQDLNGAVLNFIEHSVTYETRVKSTALVSDDDVVSIPGIERVWRVMLEAPPETVESDATDFMINQYLDNEMITKRSKSCIEATHLSLVDRCVQEVISSAAKLKSFTDGALSGEDDPMVIIASEQEIRAEEMRFDRSLLFLRKFLEGMKSRPRYSPPPNRESSDLQDTLEKRGEVFQVNLQIYGSNRFSSAPRRLSLGYSNTGAELWQYLADATGFTQFSVITSGRKIELKDDDTTLRDLRMGPGGLIVTKTRGTPENVPTNVTRAASPVDSKVMNHFEELYELLDLDERLAREVFSFLSLFSAQSGVLDLVRSMSASPDELLPPEKPYRLLYCARALRSCIEDESYSSNPNMEFLHYSVTTIIATFPRLETGNPIDPLQIWIAQGLLESLLLAFRAKVTPEMSLTYIADHEKYVHHLVRMLQNGQNWVSPDPQQAPPQSLIHEPFDALIEAALHDERLWPFIQSHPSMLGLFSSVLLRDRRTEARKAILDIILGLTGSSGAKLVLKVNDPRAARSRFSTSAIETSLNQIWKLLIKILPDATQQPSQCQELCEAAIAVMRRVGKTFPSSDVTNLFEQWRQLLVMYHHKENVGHRADDHVVWGFTKLLQECCKLLRNAGVAFSANGLTKDLISNFLFPELSEAGVTVEQSRIPVLSGTTREDLYDLVLCLSQTQDDIDSIVSSLDDLVPKDHFFEANLSHDRQSLRSEVGYAGLRNLSNTCYLNSLFSQLFMNVQFREFLLGVRIVDELRQRLVIELGKVFAYMQNSYERWIDPSSAVESITPYEAEQIDVAVQMDVDEFFNLLFDRVESQIIEPEAKKAFKSFYGGQLVQQVKSKECEHISERLEPFSAVQIEIKGKAGLEASLQAYVEGEILQGDNKYSCTSCGRHVDAVKRACLKDLPDNLIFNLKRFDYDIMTGTRCKVNDEFHFPELVDMAPYTVEHLSNPESPIKPDIFELTGVIVHAGTADSGHYYSFIRQRPSSKDKRNAWVQFNDTDVTVFDPTNIKDCCFGGIDFSPSFQWPKINSAYMLFYQRTSSIQKCEQKYTQHDMNNPVRIPLPFEMEQHLCQENELFIRCYCAQDPSHARFVRLLLERMQAIDDKKCSEEHNSESKLLTITLDYIQQISSRWKELPEFESTIRTLKTYANQCSSCAKSIVQWYTGENIIRDTVLRSPYPVVRRSFAGLLCDALTKLNSGKEQHHTSNQNERAKRIKEYRDLFNTCIEALATLWDVIQRHGRAWNDYFELLASLVKLGRWEVWMILESRFLELVLELVWTHAGGITKRLRTKYHHYLTLREKNRPFSLSGMLDFFAALLSWVDLKEYSDNEFRPQSGVYFGVNYTEALMLNLTGSQQRVPAKFEWLRRIIIGRQNPTAADQIVSTLATDRYIARHVASVLETGLCDDQVGTAVSFLQPTLTFCSTCITSGLITDVVKSSLEGIETIGTHYGKDHLDFVVALMKIENERLGWRSDRFVKQALDHVQAWAPVLLIYPSNDAHYDVKVETLELLKQCLFGPLEANELDEHQMNYLRNCARKLASAAARYAKTHYVDTSVKERNVLQAGQAGPLIEVVEHALSYFDTSATQDDTPISEITEALEALKVKADAAVETLSTSWQDNDSDIADVSEFEQSDMVSP